MTDEQKMEWLGRLMGNGNVRIGQFIMDNHGTMNINNNMGEEKATSGQESGYGKDSIMEYVDRLKPMVKEEFLPMYDEMWNGILELKEVKLQVYEKGKQQGTTFNRNLVAQIIHMLSSKVFVPKANTVNMAECLEPGKGAAHPVRQKLNEVPERVIKKSIEEYLKSYF